MRTKLILSFISLFVLINCEKESFDINDINGEIVFLSRRIPNSANWNLFKMNSNGSKQKLITDLTVMCAKPVLSNSGDKLLFVHYNDNNEYELYLINIDGTERYLIDKSKRYCGSPDWSSDDTKIVYTKSRNAETNEKDIFLFNTATEEIKELTNTESNHCPKFAPFEQIIAFCNEENKSFGILTMGINGENKKRIIENGRNPIWSPQGKKIAFISSGEQNSSQIFTADTNGENKKQLTSSILHKFPGWAAEGNNSPVWTPNGKQIAYVSWEDGDPEIYIMNKNGSGKRKLTNTDKRDESPEISKDGKYIFFSSKRNLDFKSEIYVMDINGRNQTALSNNKNSDNFPIYRQR